MFVAVYSKGKTNHVSGLMLSIFLKYQF